MTLLTSIIGKSVVSRSDAEGKGKITNLTLDVAKRVVSAWQIGKGRKATFTEHSHLTGIGDAAVIVDDAASLRPAEGDVEEAVVKGHLAFLGGRVLTEAGDEIGRVVDADLDTVVGSILSVRTDSADVAADRLLGFGTYALVVAVPR